MTNDNDRQAWADLRELMTAVDSHRLQNHDPQHGDETLYAVVKQIRARHA